MVSVGTQETLDCLREAQVLNLVADDNYAATGSYCRPCQGLFATTQISACSSCGSAELEQIPDLVDAALQQALDQRAGIELIHDSEHQTELTEAPLRALLRY